MKHRKDKDEIILDLDDIRKWTNLRFPLVFSTNQSLPDTHVTFTCIVLDSLSWFFVVDLTTIQAQKSYRCENSHSLMGCCDMRLTIKSAKAPTMNLWVFLGLSAR